MQIQCFLRVQKHVSHYTLRLFHTFAIFERRQQFDAKSNLKSTKNHPQTHPKPIEKHVQKTTSKIVSISIPKSRKMDPQRAPNVSKRVPKIHKNVKKVCLGRGCEKVEKNRKKKMPGGKPTEPTQTTQK